MIRFKTVALAFMTIGFLASCDRGPSQTTVELSQPEAAKSSDPENSVASIIASVPSDMILIPAGTYTMGDSEEIDAPPHEVELSSFYMDTYLVTQEQYEKVMNENPSRWKREKNPVEQVRWSDAARYCNKRSELEGLEPCYNLETWECDFTTNGYRLPTEAEWEYACRAGTTTAYFFGDRPTKLGDFCWYERNAKGRPQAVGRKKPNPWGLYDISGNVWEWCNDFYQVDYYQQSPKTDPRGPMEGKSKVVRGGAWRFSAESCRSGYRYNENPGYVDVCFGYDIYGFRCVRNSS
jgi:formylglycine-generating enzyme required for sulfatase activity